MLELEVPLVVVIVVVGRAVVKSRLANCNCSLTFIAGVDGSMPCCFKSNASKAAGFTSVDDGGIVEMTA